MATSRRGKKIDSYTVKNQGAEAEIIIYLVNDEIDHVTKCVAKCPLLSLEFENTDIVALREAIDTRARELLIVKFEPKIYLSFQGFTKKGDLIRKTLPEYNSEEGKVECHLKIERLLYCADNGAGKPIYKHTDKDSPRRFHETIGKSESYQARHKDTIGALIDDTPENRAALLKVIDGFKLLNDQLMQIFDTKTIEKNLMLIHTRGIKMLGAKKGKDNA